MASQPWSEEDIAFLETLATRRYWIKLALERLPHRTEPAIRCMMQKIRADLGIGGTQFLNAWMIDAMDGTRQLLAALNRTGLRP